MCFTGNFALALAVDPRVAAAVVAQPTLPVLPRRLGLSSEDSAALRTRSDLHVQCYRFQRDRISPRAKLVAAEELLGPDRIRVFPLDEPDQRKHSTLTGRWRNDDAITAVCTFLHEHLTP